MINPEFDKTWRALEPAATDADVLLAWAGREGHLWRVALAAPQALSVPDEVLTAMGMLKAFREGKCSFPSSVFDTVARFFDQLAASPATVTAPAQPEKPFAGPGLWFSVDVLGNPMRQYAPGKWENFVWPSSRATLAPVADQQAAVTPFKWPNGCDRTIPRALKFLANNERPSGGEQHFNAAHLYQLAGEMERAVKMMAAAKAPMECIFCEAPSDKPGKDCSGPDGRGHIFRASIAAKAPAAQAVDARVPTEAMLAAMVGHARDRGIVMTEVDAQAIYKAARTASPASTPEAHDQHDAALWRALAEAFVKSGNAATTGRAIEMMLDAIKDPSGLASTPEASQQADESVMLHLSRELIAALKNLSFAAQTTGGTAGPDAELLAAIVQAEQALSLGAVARAMSASEASQQSSAVAVPSGWRGLSDSAWMNIVNHDHAYESFDKADAVHEAVKRTEAKLKEINTAGAATTSDDARDAALATAQRALSAILAEIGDYGRPNVRKDARAALKYIDAATQQEGGKC